MIPVLKYFRYPPPPQKKAKHFLDGTCKATTSKNIEMHLKQEDVDEMNKMIKMILLQQFNYRTFQLSFY